MNIDHTTIKNNLNNFWQDFNKILITKLKLSIAPWVPQIKVNRVIALIAITWA